MSEIWADCALRFICAESLLFSFRLRFLHRLTVPSAARPRLISRKEKSCRNLYQPDLVLIDPLVLKTLDERVTVEGYAEVVKCAAMVGGTFWQLIEKIDDAQAILKHAPELIQRSVSFKAEVVTKDEKEGSLRKLLNFGHSIGHAVELLADGRLLHGEAISIGLAEVNRILKVAD